MNSDRRNYGIALHSSDVDQKACAGTSSDLGVNDPLAGLALAPPARAEAVVVNGRIVVRDGRLLTADEDEVAREISSFGRRLSQA